MIMEENPKLTVLVMAYKRKEFIKEALKSVLNQTIPRGQYEVICVIGFKDKGFSSFLVQNDIMEIFCDGKLGERLVAGLMRSRGDVIVFLDDDDMFQKDKLQKVINVFQQSGCVYYHNNVSLIDHNSRNILLSIDPYHKQIGDTILWNPLHGYRGIIRHRGDFNMSSIAVLKEVICRYNDVLLNIDASPDTILFFLLMQTDKPFFFDAEGLTLYRIHDSETNMATNSEQIKKVSSRYYYSRLTCYQGISKIKVKKLFIGCLLESKFGAYTAGVKDLKPTFFETLRFLYTGLTRPSAFYLRLLVAAAIYGRFPKYIEKIRNDRTQKRYKNIK